VPIGREIWDTRTRVEQSSRAKKKRKTHFKGRDFRRWESSADGAEVGGK